MGSALPLGDPAPVDGALPADVRVSDDVDFGVYLHVPFCRVRCGYCDFNTYTASELGGGASQAAYSETVRSELRFGAEALTSITLKLCGIARDRGHIK